MICYFNQSQGYGEREQFNNHSVMRPKSIAEDKKPRPSLRLPKVGGTKHELTAKSLSNPMLQLALGSRSSLRVIKFLDPCNIPLGSDFLLNHHFDERLFTGKPFIDVMTTNTSAQK